MKHLLSIALIGILLVSCKKKNEAPIEPPTAGKYPILVEHNTFMVEFTGVWCDKCGKYGSPSYDAVMHKYPGKVYGINVHLEGSSFYPDPMANQVTATMHYDAAKRLGGSMGIPSFFMDNAYTSRDSLILGAVVESTWGTSPAAGLNFTHSYVGDSLKINTKCVFFQDTSGTYNVEVFLIENGIVYPQYVTATELDEDFVHHDVVRNAVYYGRGKQVASGQISDGQQFDNSFSMYVDPAWNRQNLSLVGVIQQMSGDTITNVLNCIGKE